MELVNQEEFQEALEDNRHQELTSTMNAILSSVNQKRDTELIAAVDSQSKAIHTFVEAVINLPKPTQTEVVSSVQQLGQSLLQGLSEVRSSLQTLDKPVTQPKPSEWDFTIIRNPGGYIQSVKATPKSNA